MFITCSDCKRPYTCSDREECLAKDEQSRIDALHAKIHAYESVLNLIAAPCRPDGTYNRCREAVGELALDVLKKYNSVY